VLDRRLISGFDKAGWRKLLALLFLALAVPTVVLVWQAYGQLKWEAFHQYRTIAEELTGRIDVRFIEIMNSIDARSFADYAFLIVSGEPSANFVQRSPLSAYPVQADVPGVIGYFQVDPDGTFSTPILPPEGTNPTGLGIGAAEYASRMQLARQIQTVLADNSLVRSRPESGARRSLATAPAALGADDADASDENRTLVGQSGAEIARTTGGALPSAPESRNEASFERDSAAESETVDFAARSRDMTADRVPVAGRGYSQRIFDELNETQDAAREAADDAESATLNDAGAASVAEDRSGPKVSELKFHAALQKKSEQLERRTDSKARTEAYRADASNRTKRKEQIALPESVAPQARQSLANVSGPTDLRISTFESEIDPFEFSLLDSGHWVLFRRVWRDGERYIQGLLLDRDAFTNELIGKPFMDTVLAGMSSLIVGYQDEVIRAFIGDDHSSYPDVAERLDHTLLFRSRLTAPFNSLELVFSIQNLPPGPGGRVLAWVSLVLALVFVGGFATLHQLGLGQIELARQQQDFVSAVSHELKTPLTSIRMYGEMLREGWVDEARRQSYYEFIHDESERLSRLISNVLQLARISRNDPQFDLQPKTVGELMSNIESKIAGQVERAGFELRFRRDAAADAAVIRVDEDCFAQIIINLVDNAIKFSRNAVEKVIEVSSRLDPNDRIAISVRDFGPGVPTDQMKKIFRLFYRSGSELTRETVGTGIGLAIVHQLTTAMNGSVDLANAEPGAEFRITFPRVR
jgi:signal transduction histidine kinase